MQLYLDRYMDRLLTLFPFYVREMSELRKENDELRFDLETEKAVNDVYNDYVTQLNDDVVRQTETIDFLKEKLTDAAVEIGLLEASVQESRDDLAHANELAALAEERAEAFLESFADYIVFNVNANKS